jgi:hypothetical protein
MRYPKEERFQQEYMGVISPHIPISSTLDAVLEKVGGQSLALLLIVLSHKSKPIWIALRGHLELGPALLLGGLRRHRGAEVAAVAGLTLSTCSARALVGGRGLASAVRRGTTSSKVLVGELVYKSVCWIIGSRGGALLVCSLGSLRIARWDLMRVAARILVVHEVSLSSITSSILLLLSRLRVGRLCTLGLRLEDRVGEGGGGCRVGAVVRHELFVIVPEIQVETVGIVVIHHRRLCRYDRRSVVVGLEGDVVRLKDVEECKKVKPPRDKGDEIYFSSRCQHRIFNTGYTSVA